MSTNPFELVAPCDSCTKPHLALTLADGLCVVCLASRSRTLALAAQSIPAPLVSLAADVVRETHALAVVESTIRGDFDHDPADDCGCDRCVLTRAELNERYDALSAEIDDGVWLCLAGDGPENSAVDSGEAA